MKINLNDKNITKVNADVEIIITAPENLSKSNDIKLLEKVNFKAQDEEVILLLEKQKIYVGCEDNSYDAIAIAIAAAIKELKKTTFSSAKVLLENDDENILKPLVEGAFLGEYEFLKYKAKKENSNKIKLSIVCKKLTTLLVNTLEDSVIIASSVNKVRDFVNTIPNDFFPKAMSREAKKIAKNEDVSVKIHGEDYLDNNKMHTMLAVGRASIHESQLIHLTYKPKNATKKIVLVGKGLTYDSGGLSLKPADGMLGMKSDKGGGCAVLGIINAVSLLKLPIEVHGIIGAVENMIGGDAYKPDDVLIAKNGTSIEIKNTDAEGRLVLADCLCYAQEQVEDLDYIFDFATLTGAAMVGVGQYTTAIMGNDTSLKCSAVGTALRAGELATNLPFNRHLRKLIKSDIADIANLGTTRLGGAITAGIFLDTFITKKNKNKWLHFDIAAPAYVTHAWGYNPIGASGAGVRMTVEFLKNLDNNKC